MTHDFHGLHVTLGGFWDAVHNSRTAEVFLVWLVIREHSLPTARQLFPAVPNWKGLVERLPAWNHLRSIWICPAFSMVGNHISHAPQTRISSANQVECRTLPTASHVYDSNRLDCCT